MSRDESIWQSALSHSSYEDRIDMYIRIWLRIYIQIHSVDFDEIIISVWVRLFFEYREKMTKRE